MDRQEKIYTDGLLLDNLNLRTCCDLLSQALIHGGMDRQWEALQVFETLINKKQHSRTRKGKPITYRVAGKRKGKSYGFNCEPFQPKHPTEDQ